MQTSSSSTILRAITASFSSGGANVKFSKAYVFACGVWSCDWARQSWRSSSPWPCHTFNGERVPAVGNDHRHFTVEETCLLLFWGMQPEDVTLPFETRRYNFIWIHSLGLLTILLKTAHLWESLFIVPQHFPRHQVAQAEVLPPSRGFGRAILWLQQGHIRLPSGTSAG